MTVEACVAFCGIGDFIYAGVEFSTSVDPTCFTHSLELNSCLVLQSMLYV